MKIHPESIPAEVLQVTSGLVAAGFEAYVVGGCIRDLLIGKEPNDWDITTNATPEDIQRIFPHTYYTNEFGTVGVVNDETPHERLKVVEVTPYRLEGKYSDSRRPDEVLWSNKLDDDLKRRDFTINALAYSPQTDTLVDNYGGQADLQSGLLRAVGEARERFAEDALRILRAIRLCAELDFAIEPATKDAMVAEVDRLERISKERIRDEFIRMLNSPKPMKAIVLAQSIGALRYIAPDLERGMGVEQNQAHSYDVWEHNLRSLQHAADKGWSFDIRLSALFHDVSKPETRRRSDEKRDWTFYGHDVVGARVTKKALQDLRFPKETVEKVSNLVRWHMFFSDPEKVTLSAVRRIVRNVGQENIWDLVNLRICDRIGTGRPKEQPFRLRKYQSMIEEALRAPLTVGMLKINGNDLLQMGEKPGPRIGFMLHALLEEVLDAPEKNTEEYLRKRVGELSTISDDELRKLGEAGKERKEEEEQESVRELRKKYHVE